MYTEKELDELLDREGLQLQQGDRDSDGSMIIAWKEDNTYHPRNWSWTRRIYDGFFMFFLQFFTTVMATAGVSLGLAAQDEYGISRIVAIVTFALTYQLGRIVGTLTLPPYTESFGRKSTFIASSFIYSIGCLICGVVPNIAGVVIGRLLSGAASTVGGAVAAGAVQDMYATEARVWAVFLWTATAVGGLAIGPIYGSYLAEAIGWCVPIMRKEIYADTDQAMGILHCSGCNVRCSMYVLFDARKPSLANPAEACTAHSRAHWSRRPHLQGLLCATKLQDVCEEISGVTCIALDHGADRSSCHYAFSHCLVTFVPLYGVIKHRFWALRLHRSAIIAVFHSYSNRCVWRNTTPYLRLQSTPQKERQQRDPEPGR